jgi:hypothetical protein
MAIPWHFLGAVVGGGVEEPLVSADLAGAWGPGKKTCQYRAVNGESRFDASWLDRLAEAARSDRGALNVLPGRWRAGLAGRRQSRRRGSLACRWVRLPVRGGWWWWR